VSTVDTVTSAVVLSIERVLLYLMGCKMETKTCYICLITVDYKL